MRHIKCILLYILSALSVAAYGRNFVLKQGTTLKIACSDGEVNPVMTSLGLFAADYNAVFAADVKIGCKQKGCDVVVGTLGVSPLIDKCGVDCSPIRGRHEAFMMKVTADGRLLIAGSDKRGTAYGVMQLSRLIGVSPWTWWADSAPESLDSFSLPEGYSDIQIPTVDYRGIFINDEDWGLNPWSYLTYEPSDVKGQIGPKTHERIFELLLRLRANTFWPAMHECSVPFYFTEGNREMADRFGVYIGTSHCEPMMRNTNGEWRRDGVGEYDFVNNRDNVLTFWRNRVKSVAGSDNIYTLGMRGVHDGAMNGAKTVEEQKRVLADVISEQRKMLGQYVDGDITGVPQVFIPYKEVLDVYNAGLSVPDDVTLMWCDDNYGYIRHFPTEAERTRGGGNGIYYHTSYWGRPHDYLWISGTDPALIRQQMSLAYDRGIRRMWILNVGDIKPLEYQIELFLDMAWNIEQVNTAGVKTHRYNYLKREFGADVADALMPAMDEYYRLSFIRRPEFLGNTRVEERDAKYKVVSDLPWSDEEIKSRLAAYQQISDAVERAKTDVPERQLATYYQLVEYPVLAAAQMNRKLLTAQLARHGAADSTECFAAYDSIVSLTERYNTPKWRGIMDYRPRRLPVFDCPKFGGDVSSAAAPLSAALSAAPLASPAMAASSSASSSASLSALAPAASAVPAITIPASAFASFASPDSSTEDGEIHSPEIYNGLGYSGSAVGVAKGYTLIYEFEYNANGNANASTTSSTADRCRSDSVNVEFALLPNHPVDGNKLRFAVSVDGGEEQIISYETYGRSEEWKMNILRDQALRRITMPIANGEKHSISFRAVDDGVVLDQVIVTDIGM